VQARLGPERDLAHESAKVSPSNLSGYKAWF
jgi:hypothetical protein